MFFKELIYHLKSQLNGYKIDEKGIGEGGERGL